MPKFNIDEQYQKLFEPIVVTVDSVDYTVGKIEAETLESMVANVNNPSGMRKAFAKLVNVDEKNFRKTDFRLLALAMRAINETMTEQLGKFQSKNAQRGSAEKTAQ